MEQIYQGLLGVAQSAAERRPVQDQRPGSAGECPQDSFQKLLEQGAKEAAAQSQEPETAKGQEDLQAGGPTAESSGELDLELQKQMMLAALAMFQGPVRQVQPELQQTQIEGAQAPVQIQMDAAPQQGQEQGVQQLPIQGAADAVPAEQPDQPAVVQEQAVVQPETVRQSVEQRSEEQMSGQQRMDAAAESKPREEQEQVETEIQGPVFREVREIPVKVGEVQTGRPPEQARPVAEQVLQKLTAAVDGKETKVDIQLEPEQLGKIQVEMTWDGDGALRISMHADNAQTQKLLERDLPGLQMALARNGQQDVTVEVERQQESQRQDLSDGQHSQQQGRQQEGRSQRDSRQEDFMQQLRLGLISLDEDLS